MPRSEINWSTYSRAQVEEMAQTPGPTGASARVFLNRGGQALGQPQPAPTPIPVAKGDLAYSLLTPEQKAQVNTQLQHKEFTAQVEAAVVAVTQVASQVQQAVTVATEAGVDTSALTEAVQSVVTASTVSS